MFSYIIPLKRDLAKRQMMLRYWKWVMFKKRNKQC
jgi:hypothetical protein